MTTVIMRQNLWLSVKALLKTAFNTVCPDSFAPISMDQREHGCDESIYGRTVGRLRCNLTFV